MFRVAVDFGTSSTVTVAAPSDGPPQVVVIDGGPLFSSGVFGAADGTLFVGRDAEQQAAVDPSRYEPHPKRHLDEGEFLLGDTVFPAVTLVGAVLGRAVGEARALVRRPVDQLVLTHPAQWAATRIGVLRQAAATLAEQVVLVPEPVAAAVFHSRRHPLRDGQALAVLDLGAGTVDASVVRRGPGGFEVPATRGDPTFGGADVDQAIIDHLGLTTAPERRAAWQAMLTGRDTGQRRSLRSLRADVRGAKEALSRHSHADVAMPPPFPDAHLSRSDLERLIEEPIRRTVTLLTDTMTDSGVSSADLVGVFLVGGSSRIPLVGRMIHELTGRLPITLDQPETVVARGALDAVPEPLAEAPTTRIIPAHPGRMPSPGPRVVSAAPAGPLPPACLGSPADSIEVQEPTGRIPPVSATPPWADAPEGGPRGGGRRRLPVVGLVVLLVVALAGLGWWLSTPVSTDSREIARFDYRFSVPEGWRESGGERDSLQTIISPDGTPGSSNLIVVQEFRLAFDADAEPDRAHAQLRRLVETARFGDFGERAEFAGRSFAHYQERRQAITVDWYVLFAGHLQVSVGCGYPPESRDTVLRACAEVARTVSPIT